MKTPENYDQSNHVKLISVRLTTSHQSWNEREREREGEREMAKSAAMAKTLVWRG